MYIRGKTNITIHVGSNTRNYYPTIVTETKRKYFVVFLDNVLVIHSCYENSMVTQTAAFVLGLKKTPLLRRCCQYSTIEGRYTLNIEANKLDRNVLTTFNNPRNKKLKAKYRYLAGL